MIYKWSTKLLTHNLKKKYLERELPGETDVKICQEFMLLKGVQRKTLLYQFCFGSLVNFRTASLLSKQTISSLTSSNANEISHSQPNLQVLLILVLPNQCLTFAGERCFLFFFFCKSTGSRICFLSRFCCSDASVKVISCFTLIC